MSMTRPILEAASAPGWEVRLGRWQDVLEDVSEAGAVICDPPYSARTHDGWNEGEIQVRDATGQATREVDPNTYDLAVRRLRRGYTPDMFGGSK